MVLVAAVASPANPVVSWGIVNGLVPFAGSTGVGARTAKCSARGSATLVAETQT